MKQLVEDYVLNTYLECNLKLKNLILPYLEHAVQDYINALKVAGGVMNSTIVMAGIIIGKDIKSLFTFTLHSEVIGGVFS